MIENVDTPPNLDELASAVGLSQFQLHRIFKLALGVTPRQYAVAGRNRRIRGRLAGGQSVTRAIYGAGFNSSSRFYAESASILGMIPAAFRAGGANTTIRFAVGHCWLGEILVAATPTGVCAILLGDDPEKLVQELVDLFPAAELVGDDSCFAGWMAQIVAFVAEPRIGLNLPLDIQGTAFQHRVWDALRRIPPGTVLTYTELARRIGRPRAVRAVARACGANRLAVAIPCHRVVRTDGSPAGYRWGVERKQALIRREQRRGQDSPATIEGR
jgi:AraC family transcriptional regulator of adaptative response/methylated-DNA-[protein]-cysteine methyltransferase